MHDRDIEEIKDGLRTLKKELDDIKDLIRDRCIVPVERHEDRFKTFKWLLGGISTILLSVVGYLLKEKL